MGCGAAKACRTDGPPAEVPKPVAFEIPIDPVVVNDGDGDSASSACKKEPPKRLARLEEHRPSIPTAQELEEKLQKAEERRQEIIEERINKSKAFQQKFSEKTNNSVESADE